MGNPITLEVPFPGYGCAAVPCPIPVQVLPHPCGFSLVSLGKLIAMCDGFWSLAVSVQDHKDYPIFKGCPLTLTPSVTASLFCNSWGVFLYTSAFLIQHRE